MKAGVGGARLGSSQHGGRRDTYQGPRVPPNLLRKSVPPTSAPLRSAPLRGAPLRCAALTAAPPPASSDASSIMRIDA